MTNLLKKTASIPTNLSHKPIIACNYTDLTGDDKDDAKFLSIGRAQYSKDCASVKILRHTGKQWSRQSEEIPLERLFDLALMLGNTIKTIQNNNILIPSSLNEEVISPNEIPFLKQEIESHKERIMRSAKNLRDILNNLNY